MSLPGNITHDQQVEDRTPQERLLLLEEQLLNKYSVHQGIQWSRAERAQLKFGSQADADTLAYSEVLLPSFVELMLNLKEYDISFPENAVFIDVGSGLGKLLIAASMVKLFKRAIGIELLASLHRKATELQTLFAKNFRNPLDQCEVELLHGDGTYIDWSYAHLVLIHATSFDEHMMKRITDIAQKMLLDSVLMIINNRLLQEQNFELVRIVNIELSYGVGQLFLYRKMLRGGTPSETAAIKLKEVLNRVYPL